MRENSIEQKASSFIIIVSILIPVVVAILFGVKLKDYGFDVEPLSFLPPIYATTNAITAVVLVAAVAVGQCARVAGPPRPWAYLALPRTWPIRKSVTCKARCRLAAAASI
mgnify:CR=1 FL=1